MSTDTYSTEYFVKCLLCKETYKDARLLPCVHSFCIGCLYSSTEANPNSDGLLSRCPLCKKEFKITDEGLKGLRKDPLVEKSVTVETLTSPRSPDKCCEAYHEDKTGDRSSVVGLPKADCYCIACSQYLCCSCGVGHGKNKLTKTHGVVNFRSSHATVLEQFRNSSSVTSCTEHKEPMLLYCVDCRSLVCATCLTERHLQHRLLPVTQAAEGLRAELRGFVAGASSLASSTGNGIRKIRNEMAEFTRKSDDCERIISLAVDDLRRLVDAAGRELLEELRRTKQRRTGERLTAIERLQHRLDSVERFTKYCSGLDETGSPSDVCEVFEILNSRIEELRAVHVLPTDEKSEEFEIVLERNKDLFSSEENIIEKLKEMKNSNTNTADSSHLPKMPWIIHVEDPEAENAIRDPLFGHERFEKKREILDDDQRLNAVSSDSPTHMTESPSDDRTSISKTPTLDKVSRSCPRAFLSTIDNYRINETAIQDCADHDQGHSSTKSEGKVSASIERGERQLDEREQESLAVYVKSEFNGNFNEIKDKKNQDSERRAMVTDSTFTITAKSASASVLGETIIIDDDSTSSNSDNRIIKSNVETTEKLALGAVRMRRSLGEFEAERILESQPETRCTSRDALSNFKKCSKRTGPDDLPTVRLDDNYYDDFSAEMSSASSLDSMDYNENAPNERKSKFRRKAFDKIPSSTDEESLRRETKSGKELRFSNVGTISSVLKGDAGASNAVEDIKGKGKLNSSLNSANGYIEIASRSAFRFIKQEDDDDDDDDEFFSPLPDIGNTIDDDNLDVQREAHQMEMGHRKRKRKSSTNDHKEEHKDRGTLELVHKLSGQSSNICGVTHLRGILYVLNKKSVCTYQAQHPYSLLGRIRLKGVVSPNDIAASARHSAVYVTDFAGYRNDPERHSIWRLSVDDRPEAEPTRWLSGIVEPYTLSVGRDGHVVFLSVRQEGSSIEVREGDDDASAVASIQLPTEMVGAEHAVQTSKGTFVVCHATAGHRPEWTLSEVDPNGEIVRRLSRGGAGVRLDEPKHLAVDLDDRVFVANWKRGEVVVLAGGLDWEDPGGVFVEGGTKDRPGRLCYVRGSNLLIVVNDMKQSRVYTVMTPMPVRS